MSDNENKKMGGFVIEEDDSNVDLEVEYSEKKEHDKDKKDADKKEKDQKAKDTKKEEAASDHSGLARIQEKFKGAIAVNAEAEAEAAPKRDIQKIEEEIKKEATAEPKEPGREPTTAELYPQAVKKEAEIIYALRTTANREDQVMDFVTSNAQKKKLGVFSVIRPHGLRGYIFLEASTRYDAEQAAYNIPYARGILPKVVYYSEIEHMLEQIKREVNIQKNDIVEIISGPFKREKAKISRIDKAKEEVVVELLEAAVPIPITLKLDTVKVIRRDESGGAVENEE